MDLNLLHVFAAIYRDRNLSKAASGLGISRPAVSLALRRLREELQDPLFIRKAHGVEPTVRADALADKLELALELIEQATKPVTEFDPSSENRTFVIGMSNYCAVTVLPPLLQHLYRNAPGITLTIRQLGSETVRKALDVGIFDLLVGCVPAPLGPTRQQQLLTERFCGLVSHSHPLANRSFSPEELNRYPALLTEGPTDDRWWEEARIKATGYAPRQVFSIPGYIGIPFLLTEFPAVWVTARRLSHAFTKNYPVTEIPLPFVDQPIVIRQYWNERWHCDPAHRWLRQQIHRVSQDL